MHVCLSMDSQIGMSGLAHVGPMIFAPSVDLCAPGRLLGCIVMHASLRVTPAMEAGLTVPRYMLCAVAFRRGIIAPPFWRSMSLYLFVKSGIDARRKLRKPDNRTRA
jgi:hypothetical protein